MSEVSAETMVLVGEVHQIACDLKESGYAAIGKMNTLYERLLSEIVKRDKLIEELETEIQEQIDVIISQKNQLKRRG
jgi:hypothetical protein